MLSSKNLPSEFLSLLLDGRVSVFSKLVLGVAVGGYLLFPLDIIPDLLLPLGILDDGGVIITAVYVFIQHARQQLERSAMSEEKAKNEATPVIHISNGSASGCTQVTLGCFALMGILTLVPVVGTVVLILSGFLTVNGLFSSIGGFLGQPATAEVTSSRTIVTSLQPLGQLVSVSAEVTQADIHVSVNTGGINLCGHSANHVAQGVIEAGIDITQVDENNVSYDASTNTYRITLPAPSITSCRIEYIRQYERSGGGVGCTVDWDTVRVLAQFESMSLFTEDTLQGGILERAERETTLLMQSFVSALTGSNVEIGYADSPSEPALPPSCVPQVPRGWSLTAENNEWIKTE